MNPIESLRTLVDSAARSYAMKSRNAVYGPGYDEKQARLKMEQEALDPQVALLNEQVRDKDQANKAEMEAAREANPSEPSADMALSKYRAQGLKTGRETAMAKLRFENAQTAQVEGAPGEARLGRESAERIAGVRAGATTGAAGIRAGATTESAEIRAKASAGGTTWQPSVDAEGNPLRVSVPKNAPVGATVGGPGTAMEQNRESMSEVAKATGETILHKLSDPEYMAVVGPAAGRFQHWNAALGSGDPTFLGLKTEIRALSQVLTGIHNLRSARAGEALESVLSTSNSPEALAGAIQGALVVVDEFLKTKKARGAKGGYQPPEAKAKPAPAGGSVEYDFIPGKGLVQRQ